MNYLKKTGTALSTLALLSAAASAQSAPASAQALVRDILLTDCASPAEVRDTDRLLAANRAAVVPLLLESIRGELTTLEKNEIMRKAVLEYDRVQKVSGKNPGIKAALGTDPSAYAAKRLSERSSSHKQRAVNAVLAHGSSADLDALKALAASTSLDAATKRAIGEGLRKLGK